MMIKHLSLLLTPVKWVRIHEEHNTDAGIVSYKLLGKKLLVWKKNTCKEVDDL